MMKYYETTFEDYINAKKSCNIHDEIEKIGFPESDMEMKNMIFYGPSGVGKYSEVLYMLSKYSQSVLKYEKKVIIGTEKQDFTFHMSDIHFEIDMSLLGCNARMLFHEAFGQIIEILMMKNHKVGFLVCKNFHYINNELLEIFYSYVQQVSLNANIKLYFILITEHISFLPNNILESFIKINMRRPEKMKYQYIVPIFTKVDSINSCIKKMGNSHHTSIECGKRLDFDVVNITNAKELKILSNKTEKELPFDTFNKICDPIIDAMKKPQIDFMHLRELIYDILTYNLDVLECVWYIYTFFVNFNYLSKEQIARINDKLYANLCYYNNNYRPIYHLESIFIYMIKEIHGL